MPMIGIADGHHIYIIFLCSFKSMFDLQAAHTSTKVLGRWKSQKRGKATFIQAGRENDKGNFFPGLR